MTIDVIKSIVKALPENDTIIIYQNCFGVHAYKPSRMFDKLSVLFDSDTSTQFVLITTLLNMVDHLARNYYTEEISDKIFGVWCDAINHVENVFFIDYITL